MQTLWEYLVVRGGKLDQPGPMGMQWTVDGAPLDQMTGWRWNKALNHFGADGWELVHVQWANTYPGVTWTFRRPGES
jgi:hypothetical protein